MAYRSLLSARNLPLGDVEALLEQAQWYAEKLGPGSYKSTTLRGFSTLLLFYESSTRTRVSFELAGKLLGSDTINVSAKGSSVDKGESLRDTAQTLAAMGFAVTIIRHESADGAQLFAQHYPYSVINAGAGRGEHPTQALLDALTLRQSGVLAAGKHLAIVGDIQHSRVMRSGADLLTRLGLKITLVAPPSLMPEAWIAGAHGCAPEQGGDESKTGAHPCAPAYSPDLDSVLPHVDAVMMLRMQRERMGGGEVTTLDEFSRLYGLNRRRLALLRRDAVILHPGPVNRGVEVGEDVFADPRCRINDQVAAGLALRCALLSWACGKDGRSDG